ncbi:STAS domain-containing protein [Actinospica sp.]|jgi:anti-anti-sigma factor|uniref:STAS domain-containing protein n=1 Tax=Actinospica sp. TaxID=1872142 RepID=UPI002C44C3A3|nr:STAS domain-containing protein [Actinospica sp.]HWG28125.1 STAS domain-containing protein [Actinospica sp.]
MTEPFATASIQVLPEAAPRPGAPLVLTVEGELEETTAAPFSAALTEAVGGHDGPDVLLDLGRLYRLDPVGLDAIAAAAARLAGHGRRLVLAGVRPRVREFLSLAGAEALVPVFPTLEQAGLHM